MTVSMIGGQGAGGSFLGSAMFNLVGQMACTLTGYAGLDVTTGSMVTHATRGTAFMGAPESGSPQTSVTVSPGKPARVNFGWGEAPRYNATSCPKVTALSVTAPGLHAATTSSSGFSTQLCSAPGVGFVVASGAA